MTERAVAGADLDLLELALMLGLRLPGAEAGVLTDAERTPIARIEPDGSVSALRPLAPRPELRGAAAPALPLRRPGVGALVFDDLPTRDQVGLADAAGGELVWIALTGRERDRIPAGALLAAVEAAASAWSARTGRPASVVPLPWSLDARPTLLPAPQELVGGGDALAGWIAEALGVETALVLGETDGHRALRGLEEDAAHTARALLPAAVQPFRRGAPDRGLVVLLSGLSGSGKSTIARALAAALEADGTTVSVLDGDEVRQLLSAGLGFDAEGRALNVRRIGWVAAEIARAGGTAIAAPIAPFAAGRAEMRRMVEERGGRFVLVHVATPLGVCEARDRKGLYAAARAGRIADFTGISSPYETPLDADVTVDTAVASVEEAVAAVRAAVEGGAR
ncbi:adenylyl-sulfate kinase [Amnibacterium kyonggiense]|uniref:adenylyl-sulfate kinase n=1 Tax=Amnibacterium kyonggiense TaxID=595671 RepID=UPI001FE5FB51|nr:adenylyl-sulfate kinase [Amnibacterium kyonggiense]